MNSYPKGKRPKQRRILSNCSAGWFNHLRRKRAPKPQKPHPLLQVMTDGQIWEPEYDDNGNRKVFRDRDKYTKKQRAMSKLPPRGESNGAEDTWWPPAEDKFPLSKILPVVGFGETSTWGHNAKSEKAEVGPRQKGGPEDHLDR